MALHKVNLGLFLLQVASDGAALPTLIASGLRGIELAVGWGLWLVLTG